MYCCSITFRYSFDRYIVTHVLFLSQPFPGCIQEPHLPLRRFRYLLQFELTLHKVIIKLIPVFVDLKHLYDICQGEPHILECCDPPDHRQLLRTVITITRKLIYFSGFQQSDIIVMTKHSDADS